MLNFNSSSLKIEKKFFILFDGQKDEKREYTKILRASYNSNVLTREQIQKLSANNIYDLFKGGAIPGVTVNGDKIQSEVEVHSIWITNLYLS